MAVQVQIVVSWVMPWFQRNLLPPSGISLSSLMPPTTDGCVDRGRDFVFRDFNADSGFCCEFSVYLMFFLNRSSVIRIRLDCIISCYLRRVL